MCDRIAIMDRGRILQVATPSEMYHSPATAFVAGFLGNPPTSFLAGRARGGRVEVDGTDLALGVTETTKRLADGGAVSIGLRPEHYGPGGDLTLPGTVVFVENQGRENLYDVRLSNGSLLRSIQPVRNDVAVGDVVNWGTSTAQFMLFDADGTRL